MELLFQFPRDFEAQLDWDPVKRELRLIPRFLQPDERIRLAYVTVSSPDIPANELAAALQLSGKNGRLKVIDAIAVASVFDKKQLTYTSRTKKVIENKGTDK